MTLRRVLILADESADWMVAGMRQLERLALSINEFAVENKESGPVVICILWRPDFDRSLRWEPQNARLTKIAFTTDLDGESYDLILNTRLFLYRKAVPQLLKVPVALSGISSAISGQELWHRHFQSVEVLPSFCEGAWEYIRDRNQISNIEKKFLRGSGKSQDGFVSRYLNRPISRVVTHLLLRFPITPNAWTLLIFPIPVVASLILLHGTYWSFLWGVVLFHVFSVLDGCDGEIARARFLESEGGRRLDDLFDVLSNILLVVALGFGLSRQANHTGHSGLFYVVEGFLAAALIGVNESYLVMRKPLINDGKFESLGGVLYPRHHELVEHSGMLLFGEKFASWLIQLTKHDVAVLFFVCLAAIGQPSWILHLLLLITAVILALAVKSSSHGRAE